jgi:hypothetical protein
MTGTTGTRSEYAQVWRARTFSHSLNTMQAAPKPMVIAATTRCARAGDAGSPTRTKASAEVAHRRSFHSAGLAARRSCSTCDAAAFAPGTAKRSYRIGSTTSVSTVALTRPPITTTAKGR